MCWSPAVHSWRSPVEAVDHIAQSVFGVDDVLERDLAGEHGEVFLLGHDAGPAWYGLIEGGVALCLIDWAETWLADEW